MKNSKTYWTWHSPKNDTTIGLGFAALSFVGFLDAAYLTISHYRGSIVPCSVTEGCEKVLASQYATVFGIPVALFGVLYYFAIFLLSVLYFMRKEEKFLFVASRYTLAGVLASIWFLGVQVFLIGAVCQYCLLSAIVSTALFGLAVKFAAKERSRQEKPLW